ncbi:MAG: hypothetical protein WC942_06705 [Clostridia bacterium]|jgi:hypothetical protein
MIKVTFEGIDSWNRPVFKDIDSRNRYGSTDILFDYDATEVEVLEKITPFYLCYFGTHFDCEPCGNSVLDIVIVKNSEVCKEPLS